MLSPTAAPPATTHGPPESSPALGRVRITPNLFGIGFGLSGLAGAWTTAARYAGVAAWPSDMLWVLAAGAWIVVLVAYVAVARGQLAARLADPAVVPFLSLAVITPMLLGAALSEHWSGPGRAIAEFCLAATVALGGWTTGTWIVKQQSLAQWHPGYFLPTVAGGLLSSQVAARLGFHDLAAVLFGYGAISWVGLGSIVLLRLFTLPMLPVVLIPTIAIEVAPPVVAGNAWFALNGGRIDAVALGLAGYAVLMVLVQLRLVPLYRTVPFGPGFWAFSFSYVAAVTFVLRWLTIAQHPDARAWIVVLLAVASSAFALLSARTLVALRGGVFLARQAP